ncbi:hypothetical protein [Patulibacter minatonensis]|uniref:hypothetical protein n=1 Tax=Patulibacter minatonensis TaxID=298163 RepID=UPI0012F87C42|nr:hypothetical protein [Patulibacter minatonensis]
MHTIASGLPVDCIRGEDYASEHLSFVASLRRFAREHDVVVRVESIQEAGDQIGWRVQYFWNLYRSEGHRTPSDFVYSDDVSEVLAKCSPYVRPRYGEIPQDLRAPLQL